MDAQHAPVPPDDEPDDPPHNGLWLTYRYRLGGDDTTPAAGTIKAPSFLSAARRLVARRLAAHLGATPAYLRLRAAGEQEVLLRVVRAGIDPAGGVQMDVVPFDRYHFDPPAGPDPDAHDRRPP